LKTFYRILRRVIVPNFRSNQRVGDVKNKFDNNRRERFLMAMFAETVLGLCMCVANSDLCAGVAWLTATSKVWFLFNATDAMQEQTPILSLCLGRCVACVICVRYVRCFWWKPILTGSEASVMSTPHN